MFLNFISTKERSGSLRKKNFLMVLLLLFSVGSLFGQSNKNYEKVVIGDYRFILHNVQKKETLYSISRLYGCSQEEILEANKNITGVIKKGMVLKIPDNSYKKPQSAKIDESKFTQYQIVSGDNYYQLKLKYGVEEEELLKYNPDLRNGLKAGKTILIPIKTKAEIAAKELSDNEPLGNEAVTPSKTKSSGQVLNVGLYLPISAVVVDSLKPTAKTLSFLAFYQGALMAVDQLSKTGLKVKMYVYDTEKSESNVEILVKKPEFLSLDLLIGPVYPDGQKIISELSAKNKIPMVSPLSSDDKFSKINPCYFQVNPVKKLRIEATSEYILQEFPKEKVIFLEGANSSSETRQIRDHLDMKRSARGITKGHSVTYNLWSNGIDELERQLQPDRPNILVMADVNEVNVSIAMNRLALLSKKYPLILIGIQEFTRMQSIETENLHQVNLRYLSTFFVNYNLPSVNTFVENFKTEFGTEPSLFAFQGYDVTTYFLKSLQKTSNLTRSLPSDKDYGLLHTSYHFTKLSGFGGYTNDNFTVVEYSNTFELRSLGVFQMRPQP